MVNSCLLYIDLFAILKRINDLVMHCQNKMQGVLMTKCPTEHDTVGIIVVISTHFQMTVVVNISFTVQDV